MAVCGWHGLMQECKPGNKAATLPSNTTCTNEQAEPGCKTEQFHTKGENVQPEKKVEEAEVSWFLMTLQFLTPTKSSEAQHTLFYPKAMCIVKIKPIKLPIVILWNQENKIKFIKKTKIKANTFSTSYSMPGTDQDTLMITSFKFDTNKISIIIILHSRMRKSKSE